uniref:Glycoprotein hormone subunit beta 5 n=1 Tax=Oncorhynchus mykiss TaxID=8022 RepID=A0A8C7SGJ4_ONCMY
MLGNIEITLWCLCRLCSVQLCCFIRQPARCGGLHITTDTCWGRCETWEKPVLDPPYIESYHRVCTYNKTHLVTVQLPTCSANMDPMYTYPVALRCDLYHLCLTAAITSTGQGEQHWTFPFSP